MSNPFVDRLVQQMEWLATHPQPPRPPLPPAAPGPVVVPGDQPAPTQAVPQ